MYVDYKASDYLEHLKLPADYKVESILVVGSWNVLGKTTQLAEVLKDYFPAAKLKPLPAAFLSTGRELSYQGRVSWFFVEYGGAKLSELLHIGSLLGSNQNLLIGSAGGLQPDLQAGDIILSSAAYKDGSMSQLYDQSEQQKHVAADLDLLQVISQKLDDKVAIGKTMTCQAMLAESRALIKRWSQQGYLGVEMEAATVLAVSKYFAVPAAAMLVISDNLIAETTVLDDQYRLARPTIATTSRRLYKVALDLLLGTEH